MGNFASYRAEIKDKLREDGGSMEGVCLLFIENVIQAVLKKAPVKKEKHTMKEGEFSVSYWVATN